MLERARTITLCMIVKNEELQLPRCLDSVQGIVREIVVVDTGSTDETAAIARRYGAKVIEAPWKGDFAAARNEGVREARGDWILFLDADEALDAEKGPRLLELVQHDEYEGFFLQIHNYVGDGSQGATINPVLRLFRRRPEHLFEGRIHEQIAAAILRRQPGAAFHLTDVPIHHYGYRQEWVVAKDKIRRNAELLEEALRDEPNNAFYWYNIGVEYLRMNRAGDALDSFRRAKGLMDSDALSYAHLLCKYEVRCLQAMGRWEQALERLGEAERQFPEYTDLLQYRAACELALGRREDARRSLAKAMNLGPPPALYHTEEGIGTYRTAYALGLLNEEEGEIEEALNWYVEAIRGKPSLTPPLYRSFLLMRLSGRERRIGDWIRSRLREQSPDAFLKLLGILLRCRCGLAVLELLKRPEGRRLPRSLRLETETEARLQLGELTGAMRLLKPHGTEGRPELLEQLEWLERVEATGSGRKMEAGRSGGWRSPLVRYLAGSGMEDIGEAPWRQLQRLLEAAWASGRRAAFAALLERWDALLQHGLPVKGASRGKASEGTEALVRSLSSIADRHLAVLRKGAASKEGAALLPMERKLLSIRLKLPAEDGFR
ncbi:glycosyltransferase family 2 protein [Cohnella sp. AR92]|uniref:glycosyltransferase n=1 Tax=Cohnella sp. AR92 TaxID=648716 RepID=UPI0013155773|nr:glycosyltransferase family 2 protein [Cohnella sp. AR92]